MQIASVDYNLKRMYLHQDTVASGFDAILAYFEICGLRCVNALGEQKRKQPYLGAEGYVRKTSTSATPRFAYLEPGWRYVPYAGITHRLSLLCEIVSIDELTDSDVFDLGGLSVNVHIGSDYDQVEIREVSAGSVLTDEESDILMSTKYIPKNVFVDSSRTVNGDGSALNPFDNIGDTIDFAEDNNIREIIVLDEIELDRNLKNFVIGGLGAPVISCGGWDLKGSEFRHCTLRGPYIGRIIAQQCVLDDGFYLCGFFQNCALSALLTMMDGADALVKDCSGLGGQVVISLNGSGTAFLTVEQFSGDLVVKDCNTPGDIANVGVSMGSLNLDISNTDGNIWAHGQCKYSNNANGSVVDDAALLQQIIWNNIDLIKT